MTREQAGRTRRICYFTNLVMASVFSLPPLLFATFHDMYGISYTLLGTLVLINFCTQLGIDLVFSFFSRYFNIRKTVRLMPLLTAAGLCLYAVIPALFPQRAYAGLVIGTFLFSVAAGLGEVLVSPVIAALPSPTPEKDLSILHSLYGYGLVSVVLVSTVFIRLFGHENWMILALFWAALPAVASLLLCRCELPDLNMAQEAAQKTRTKARTTGLVLCMGCIFLGASAENTMSNWISVYAENVLHLSKMWGDLFGMCLFAALLALTRTMYGKFGRNIFRVLMLSMAGAMTGYVAVAFLRNGALALAACVTLGVSTSMLWPGTLILMEEKIPAPGVAAYALMAAGGDLGASIAPQSLGMMVDRIAASDWAAAMSRTLALTPEELGFKAGMLMAAVFPLLGLALLAYMKRYFRRHG